MPPQHEPPLLLVQAPEVLLQGEQAAVAVTVSVGRHAIHDAVLTGRAVHAGSQQALGLVPSGAAAGSLPQQADGGGRVLLGDLPAGQQQRVTLLLDARFAGAVDIAAELQVGVAGAGLLQWRCCSS